MDIPPPPYTPRAVTLPLQKGRQYTAVPAGRLAIHFTDMFTLITT